MILLDGQKIKRLREEKGLSQFELSLETDLNRVSIALIETQKKSKNPGSKGVLLETAVRLAKFFDVKVDDLLLKEEFHFYE